MVDRTTFPLTLAALKSTSASQWEVGDALLTEIPSEFGTRTPQGVNDGSRAQIEACAKYLEKNNFPENIGYLAKLRNAANSFPSSTRKANISWSAHYEAGTPENLRRASQRLKDIGKPVTQDNIRVVMDEWIAQEQEEEERRMQAEFEAAERAKQAAKDKLEKARDDQRNAETEAQKKKAAEKAAQAKADFDVAKAAAKEAAVPSFPASRRGSVSTLKTEPPPPSQLLISTAIMAFEGDVERMAGKLEKFSDEIRGASAYLTKEQIKDIDEKCSSILKHVDAILELIGKRPKGAARKFSTIEGGLAAS